MITFPKLGQDPISPKSPAGTEIRYKADFLALQGEMDKLTSLVGIAGGVNWDEVVALASKILAEQSKDILVAAYLGVGLAEKNGHRGLGLGIKVLADLLENYWETMFPPLKRVRARVNALDWWRGKVTTWVDKHKKESVHCQEHQDLIDELNRLEQLIGEKMLETDSLLELKRLVSSWPTLAPQPECFLTGKPATPSPEMNQPKSDQMEMEAPKISPPQADPQATLQPAEQVESEKSTTFLPASEALKALEAETVIPLETDDKFSQIGNFHQEPESEDLTAARLNLQRAAGEFADWISQDNLADPWGWRARRWRVWLGLKKSPPSEDGCIFLPSPPPELRDSLVVLLKGGKFQEAAYEAEFQVGAHLFWLDLHYFCHQALLGMGPEYQAAAKAVYQETRFFIDCLPELLDLCYTDSVPLANTVTRAWLTAGQGGELKLGQDDNLISEISQLVAAGELREALVLLAEKRRTTADGPGRLSLLIIQIEILSQLGHRSPAVELAEQVVAEIDHRELEVWAPPLARRGLMAAYKVMQMDGTATGSKNQKSLLARLMVLDPVLALTMPAEEAQSP